MSGVSANGDAFGAPGIEPRWTSSAKEGVGTAYHTSCRVWFTISHGIINEIYYPHVDRPNTRDFQFLITDGRTFCHEEKRDLRHRVDFPEHDCLLYRLTNSERNDRYRLVKHVLTDPHRSVLLVHTKLEVNDASLQGKLRVYALMAPQGAGNSAWCSEIGANQLLRAQRGEIHLVIGSSCGFSRRSVGYVGFSDGWQDLTRHFKMDWEFRVAEHGNVAMTGEIAVPDSGEFTVAIACGGSYQSTAVKLLQALSDSYETHREAYVRQWQRAVVNPEFDFSGDTGDAGHLYRLSRCVLLAHEDKVFQGAIVASMSIPWGETKATEEDCGGYHLVWTRDLVQSATALLATGQTATPLRALIWLAAIQHTDGSFPQNCWIDGTAYWSGLQLDEIAAPMLLAWRLYYHKISLHLFNPRWMMVRAAAYLILQGPVTCQERWEENSGYSPSTLATVVAALAAAGQIARDHHHTELSEFILVYADWLAVHLEDWLVTTKGELVEGIQRHYIRINPTDSANPDPHPDADTALLQVANGGGLHPARNVVGGDFLHLVRLGIRSADDPIIRDSIEVIDRVIKRELPQGACWRRYNHDGYGQKADGSAF
ncbi:MAG TPA: glycoside hydrolase family 15 protein, partial [Candidatus Acidoferrales bacterium]|nr:glycoside hydrolase family 15 protein [Candidatus Acidoferrales bacterium]